MAREARGLGRGGELAALALVLGLAFSPGVLQARAGEGTAPPAGEALAVVNVTLVPMTGERLVGGRTVVVREGRIAEISAAPRESLPAGTRIVDGTGRYLMPGLVDMHVHFQPTRSGEVNRKMIGLFLANGVTSVRNMLGSPEILELRDGIARGSMRGPSIFTAGPVVDGPDSQWGKSAAIVRTPGDAERVVHEQKKTGYDFVKVYNRLGRDPYLALLAAAHRQDVKVVGHVPEAVTLDDALKAGQTSIEHLLSYLDAIEALDSPVRGRPGWRYRMQAFDHVDPARIPAVAAATRDAGVWNCPTLVAMRKWVPPDEARRLLEREEMSFVPADFLEHWQPWRGFRLEGFGAADFELVERARHVNWTLVGALRRAGARLLVGTDTPSPLVVPGFSVHEELKNLVEAGLTPYEALEAATSAAAECLGKKGDFGVVAVGARADLLLLEANPLEDVGNADTLSGVVVRGRWISKDEIHSILEESAAGRR